jgi:hypothetical protein
MRAEEAPEVLYHHRMPTSTENVENACHPFSTGQFFERRYVLAHNGVIRNAYELKTAHQALGIEYGSVQPDGKFNDSEALLWDIALYLEGRQDKLNAQGSIAFIVIEHDRSGRARKLHFARNSSPLHLQLSDTRLALASEAKWNDNTDAEEIMSNFLHTFTYSSRTLAIKALEVPSYSYKSVGAGASWQKPTYTHTPTIAPGASGRIGAIAIPEKIPKITINPDLKAPLDPEFLSADKDMESDGVKTAERFTEKYSTYGEALDALGMAIGRTKRTLEQMEKIKEPKKKTVVKYYRVLRYNRVLLIAEDYLFGVVTELAELADEQKRSLGIVEA